MANGSSLRSQLSSEEVLAMLQGLSDLQRQRVLRTAQRIVPHVTQDDVMQPNDFPELENHPHFRYEEGVLEGMNTAVVAFRALLRDREAHS